MCPISSRDVEEAVGLELEAFWSAFCAGVDAQEHVLGVAVLGAEVVDVVRRDQRDAQALVHAHEVLVGVGLDRRPLRWPSQK